MRHTFLCDICGGQTANVLGVRTYSSTASDNGSEYLRLRLRVLFEIWFPGARDICFYCVMCNRCGFVSHLPRAESSDLDAKYRALTAWGGDYGRGEPYDIAQCRSLQLYRSIFTSLRPKSRLHVLDFGGGDGRLMKAFEKAGHEISLIDYNTAPLAFVQKLGDTIDALPQHTHFDLIVMSHVLEHVANPRDLLRKAVLHMRAQGHLFAEVPLEIWGKPPLPVEPVTHVNFFVQGSLRRCLQEAALSIVGCDVVRSLHPSGEYKPAVQVLARHTTDPVGPMASGVAEVGRLLKRPLGLRVGRHLLLAGGPTGIVSHFSKRHRRLARQKAVSHKRVKGS